MDQTTMWALARSLQRPPANRRRLTEDEYYRTHGGEPLWPKIGNWLIRLWRTPARIGDSLVFLPVRKSKLRRPARL